MIGTGFPLVWDCPTCADYNCDSCIDLINKIKSEIYTLESKKMAGWCCQHCFRVNPMGTNLCTCGMRREIQQVVKCGSCGKNLGANEVHNCRLENAIANEDWTLTKAKPVIGSSGEVICTSTPALDSDNVNHPKHYVDCDPVYEPINVIEAWKLGFNLGNAVKYIKRWNKKGGVEDLKKARWYLSREITNNEKSGQGK